MKKKQGKIGGFTLVEMLIVVAIISILIAVSIPLVNSALEKVRDTTVLINERAAKAEAAIVYLGASEDEPLTFQTSIEVNGQTFPLNNPSLTFYYNVTEGKLVQYDLNSDISNLDVGKAYGKCKNADGTECTSTGAIFTDITSGTGL